MAASLASASGRKDLWSAAAQDDEAVLRDLIVGEGGGCAVDERDDFGRTALHVAASQGAEGSVRVLLELGGDPNCPDRESRWTPLHRALYNGHVKVALLLLRAGAVLGDELTIWGPKAGQGVSSSSRQAGATGGGKKAGSGYGSGAGAGKSGGGERGVDADGHTPLSLVSWMLRDELKDATGQGPGAEVFTFGRADWPLGYCLPNNATYVHKPKRVDTLAIMGVVEVSAAKHHSAALTDKGEVYTWGHGRGGRLGHGDETPRMFPERVQSLQGIVITKLSASENHTAALSSHGDVYTWGSDRFGQLGHGSSGGDKGSVRLQPRLVEGLRKVVMIDVSAGSMHSAAVAASGELYTWGCNKSGQLGYDGKGGVEGTPRLAHMLFHRFCKAPRKATQVSAGASCTLVIVAPSAWMPGFSSGMEAPKVYQFGYGSHMPVRVDFRPAEKARQEGGRIEGLGGAPLSSSAGNKNGGGVCTYHHAGGGARIHIVKVAAALHHNVALSKDGVVYSWGLGADQLGLGTHEHHAATPQVVEGLGEDRAVYLSACAGHSAVVTDSGDLYTWGSSEDQGVLGHGAGKWQPTPKRVLGLKRVTKVAAGPEHTVVISSAYMPPLPHEAVLRACSAAHADAPSTQGRDSPSSLDESESMGMFDMDLDSDSVGGSLSRPPSRCTHTPLPAPSPVPLLTLKQCCERVIAGHVDMRNVVSVLAHAESLDSPDLADFCVEFITRNLDGILMAGRAADLDFLLEDAADDVNSLLHLHKPPRAAEEEEELYGEEGEGGERGRAAREAWRSKKLRASNLDEAVKWERGLKKRLARVAELEELRAQGTPLAAEQVSKVERREELQMELRSVEALIGRLKIMAAARAKRVEMEGGEATKTEMPEMAEEVGEGEKGREREGEEEVSVQKPRMCEDCGVKCVSVEAWTQHVQGKRHLKRLASVARQREEEAEEEERKRRQQQAARAKGPGEWQRGLDVPPPSPWQPPPSSSSFDASPPPAAPPRPRVAADMNTPPPPPRSTQDSYYRTPRKSFRQILEEEEAQARRHQPLTHMASSPLVGSGGARAMPMPSPQSSSSGPYSPATALRQMGPSPLTLLKPLTGASPSPSSSSSSFSLPSASSSGGGVLLSSFLPSTSSASSANKGGTPGSASASGNKAAPWAGWAMPPKPKDAPGTPSSFSRSPAVPSFMGAKGPVSPPRPSTFTSTSPSSPSVVSFSAIMAEEQRKAQLVRFNGNDSPWYTERRERADSFEVIQLKQQQEEAERAAQEAAVREKEEQEREEAELRRALRASKRMASKAGKASASGGKTEGKDGSKATPTPPGKAEGREGKGRKEAGKEEVRQGGKEGGRKGPKEGGRRDRKVEGGQTGEGVEQTPGQEGREGGPRKPRGNRAQGEGAEETGPGTEGSAGASGGRERRRERKPNEEGQVVTAQSGGGSARRRNRRKADDVNSNSATDTLPLPLPLPTPLINAAVCT